MNTDSASNATVSPASQWERPPRKPVLVDEANRMLAADYTSMEADLRPGRLAEILVKSPARALFEVINGRSAGVGLAALVIAAVCMAACGVVMGMFSGAHQLWAVPVKLVLGSLASLVICLPSLYIFVCLSGGTHSLAQVYRVATLAVALFSIILLGFAPVVWVFSQATSSAAFMGFLHFMFWGVAIGFGLRLLLAAFRYLNQCEMKTLRIWCVLYLLVQLQMCTTLRPLVGEYTGFGLQPKQFFLSHWTLAMAGR